MKRIFYPGGHENHVCRAEYEVIINHDGPVPIADIVVINSQRMQSSASVLDTQEGRDIILNKILADELKGVRVEFVRFFVMVEGERISNRMLGMELPIRLNVADYVKKGNPHEVRRVPAPSLTGWLWYLVGRGQKAVSYWSGHVRGGCAEFLTDYERRRYLSVPEVRSLCSVVGFPYKDLLMAA